MFSLLTQSPHALQLTLLQLTLLQLILLSKDLRSTALSLTYFNIFTTLLLPHLTFTWCLHPRDPPLFYTVCTFDPMIQQSVQTSISALHRQTVVFFRNHTAGFSSTFETAAPWFAHGGVICISPSWSGLISACLIWWWRLMLAAGKAGVCTFPHIRWLTHTSQWQVVWLDQNQPFSTQIDSKWNVSATCSVAAWSEFRRSCGLSLIILYVYHIQPFFNVFQSLSLISFSSSRFLPPDCTFLISALLHSPCMHVSWCSVN